MTPTNHREICIELKIMVIEDRYNKPWARYEYVLVLNQYMKMPFSKMHKANPDIIALSKLMKRTADSVAMRLVNFASCDPILANRDIKGLPGGKKQCMPYWIEFCNDRETLLFESEKILAEIQNVALEEKYHSVLNFNHELKGETKMREVKTRINQDVFRQMILSLYDNQCALTGINEPDLLVASHIRPWAEDKENRLNPKNGICLSALYDTAFDKGLIGFDNNYGVVLSQRLKSHINEKYYERYFGCIEGKTLEFPYEDYKPDINFLEYHMDCIFQR